MFGVKIEQTMVGIDSRLLTAAFVLRGRVNDRLLDLPVTPAVPADLKGEFPCSLVKKDG